MKQAGRLLLLSVSLLFGVVAYLFSPLNNKELLFGPWLAGVFLCLAVLAGWASIRLYSHKETRVIMFGVAFGIVGGFIGLFFGVLWGIFLSPDALSPILGFFITGPIGFIGGVVMGVGIGLLWKAPPKK